ncbi:MAG TPA: hypothetical protein PLI48_08270 [Gammaproteobacteria bacterium]|nr:hypothetical protein [Gammaproteobacteria bacterium]
MLLFGSSLILIVLTAMALSQKLRKFVARNRSHIALMTIFLVAAAMLGFGAIDYFSVDACLDSGGGWDHNREVCQHDDRPLPPE